MGKPLTRDEIFAAPDLPTLRVPVPEWGGDVLIRSLTLAERLRYEEQAGLTGANGTSHPKKILTAMLVMTLVDEEGHPLFTNEEDVERLSGKNSKPLRRLFRAAVKHNATDEAEVNELAKN